MTEDQEVEADVKAAEQAAKGHVDITAPMFAWILLLVIALVLRVVISLTGLVSTTGYAYGIFNSLSDFILFMPGSIIWPLVVGAVIGAQVGLKSKDLKSAERGGVLNGVYAAVVYIVAIFVIFVTMKYGLPQYAPTTTFLVGNWLALPVAILIVLSVVFAILSNSRKVA